MEAPKEIYVHICSRDCSITFSEVEEKNCENIKYLRSDLAVDREKLVGWLNEQILFYECGGIMLEQFRIHIYKEVVEKLKEL